jgi:hypothetical protein
MTWEDSIVKEVRNIRDRTAAKHHYDVRAIGRYYQQKQARVAQACNAPAAPPYSHLNLRILSPLVQYATNFHSAWTDAIYKRIRRVGNRQFSCAGPLPWRAD